VVENLVVIWHILLNTSGWMEVMVMQVVLLVVIVLSIHNNTIIPMSIIMLSSFIRSTLAYIVYGYMSLDGKFLTKVDVKL
jgi:hypothetical protein